MVSPDFNDFKARIAQLNALSNGKSPSPEPEAGWRFGGLRLAV
jgi:hypothetical protein